MPTRRFRYRRAVSCFALAVAALGIACGDDATSPPPPTSRDASTPGTDASSSSEASTTSGDGGPGARCGDSDPGETACGAACAPYAACSLPGAKVACGAGGTCAFGGFMRAVVTKCFESSGGDCARLAQCYGCSVACRYLDKANCSQPVEMGACCDACITKPSCYDAKLSVCSAVAACQ